MVLKNLAKAGRGCVYLMTHQLKLEAIHRQLRLNSRLLSAMFAGEQHLQRRRRGRNGPPHYSFCGLAPNRSATLFPLLHEVFHQQRFFLLCLQVNNTCKGADEAATARPITASAAWLQAVQPRCSPCCMKFFTNNFSFNYLQVDNTCKG